MLKLKIKRITKNIFNLKFDKQGRLKFMFWAINLLFLVVILKIISINIFDDDAEFKLYLPKHNYSKLSSRHDILDRNGNVLAVTVQSYSLYVRPNNIINKQLAIKAMVQAIGIPPSKARKIVNNKHKFVWVKRNIPVNQLQAFLRFGVIGAYVQKGFKRFYPYGNYFSTIVGVANIDGVGVSGVENYFDKELDHKDVQLSLDLRLQVILRSALAKAKKLNDAKAALGIIINPNNGEVLALSSLPDYNPNNLSNVSAESLFNNVTQGVFEQGSTFKLFTVAMALDTGDFTVDDMFDVSKPIVSHNFVLVDDTYLNRPISMPEVLIYSSDIGSSLMAKIIGADTQKEYFRKFGLFNATSLEIPEKAASIGPANWSPLTQMTLSFGYGIAVSQATEAAAIASLINGGKYIPLTLVKRDPSKSIAVTQVIKPETSTLIRRMARLVVAKGTGRVADIKGYNIGGKTGSAERVKKGGGYDRNKLFSSLVTFFPAEHPKYLIFVSIENPKRNKHNLWNVTGASVAGPAMVNIIKKMTNLLAIPKHSDGADKINRNVQSQILNFVKNGTD